MNEKLKKIFKNKEENISNFIKKKFKEKNRYASKNEEWFSIAYGTPYSNFQYIKRSDEGYNGYYYDLITIPVGRHGELYRIGIPVPILAEALDVKEEDIYLCFNNST